VRQENAAVTGGGYRGWLLALGLLLTLASAAFLGFYLKQHWSDLPPIHLTWAAGGWLLAGAALYFASLLSTAGAWLFALRALGSKLAAVPALGVALTAQIGKYAPGNVAQHIGRAALAKDRGVTVITTAKAALMEIAMAIGAARRRYCATVAGTGPSGMPLRPSGEDPETACRS